MVEEIRATIKRVVRSDVEGRSYVICEPKDPGQINGSVTFNLRVWQDTVQPDEDMEVMLSELVKRSAGWRAMSVRRVRVSD